MTAEDVGILQGMQLTQKHSVLTKFQIAALLLSARTPVSVGVNLSGNPAPYYTYITRAYRLY